MKTIVQIVLWNFMLRGKVKTIGFGQQRHVTTGQCRVGSLTDVNGSMAINGSSMLKLGCKHLI